MNLSRRQFVSSAACAGAALLARRQGKAEQGAVTGEALERAAAEPVLKRELFSTPVMIESMKLLRKGNNYLLSVRSRDGVEGISFDNGRASVLHPIINKLIIPYFIGKDARDLEDHLFGVYRHGSNYKYQGLALWAPVALVEFAVLDLLGKMAKKRIGELLGSIVRERVGFYIASGRRDSTPQEEVDYLKKLVEETGAHAVKYRVGGRMNRNVDALPGRTETLIPLSRNALGDKIAIHADSNSSYDPPQAIKVGRMLEDINAVFYEEPCPFDDFDATRRVTEALTIPVALGEQEFSEARFRYTVQHRVADIMQPDLFYYGGLIRSIRVARMAELRKMSTTCHISGGFGFVYMLHFCSCVERIGPWQEYKEGVKTYGKLFDPELKIINGELTVPTAPGVGLADSKEILKGAEVVS